MMGTAHNGRGFAALALAGWIAAVAGGAPAAEIQRPEILKRAGFEQKLNTQVPLDLTFKDEQGATVSLKELVGARPTILSLAYYECPMLCTLVLNGMGELLQQLPFKPGKDINVITISFDSRETPVLAAKKKANYLKQFSLEGDGDKWHFLTGDEASIKKLTDAVGFTFAFDEKSQEFAHASGIMVMTPDGRLSHYFYGIQYPSYDLRLALVEASRGKIGSPVDQLMLFCYHYDPVAGRYSAAFMNFVRLGCFVTIALVGAFVTRMLFREKRARAVAAGAARVPATDGKGG